MIARPLTMTFLVLLGMPAIAAPPRFSDVAGPAANAPRSAENTADDPASTEASTATATAVPKATTSVSRKTDNVEPAQKADSALVPTQQHWRSVPAILQQSNLTTLSPGYEGTWKTDSSKELCRLWQPLTNYGYVAFREGIGLPLEFVLHVDNPPAGVGQARLQITPPLWSHYTRHTDLGVMALDEEEAALSASSEWAQRLLTELAQGMNPVITFYDNADATGDTKITLSALNFTPGLQGFDACRAKLLRYNFNEARVKVIDFSPDSSKFGKQALRQIAEVLEILQVDPTIKYLNIELYSPAKELVQYNFRLATRRAQAVRDYLLAKGVSEDKLIITIHTQSQSKLKEKSIKPDQIQIVLNRDKKKKG